VYGFRARVRVQNAAGGMASGSLRRCAMFLGLIVILMLAAPWTEASLPPEDEEENVLHIGGIFPIAGEGGWQGGQVSVTSPRIFRELRSLRHSRGSDLIDHRSTRT